MSHSHPMNGMAGTNGKRHVAVVLSACGGAVMLVALAALYAFDPTRVPIFPRCTLNQVTGLTCPGCGSLRAVHQFLHGNFAGAFALNPLLILSLPLFAWWSIRTIRARLAGRPGPRIRPAWIWTYIVVCVIFGIARNLPSLSMLATTP